ncbi:MAG: miniconductance mechanosensitive channel [Tenuifilum sp.]|jgi:miniconductance mechanosensitive channel|uniref:mechanosensitive ion channel family protein n=1 Tax=Tenuifilum sp. TaxID=2760880 RepID=UPI0024AB192A|nr:mechanosensitive ion channel domain-containing protein [Tenuifilum sp.]MDI3526903.1 miniconductance mechanosensitive channel [Tenuifilum sp.]
MGNIGEQIMHKYQFLENLESWLLGFGMSEQIAQLSKVAISLAGIALLAIIADFLVKRIFITSMVRIARYTKTDWDDILVEKRFFHQLAHFAPAILVYLTIGIALYDYSPGVTAFLQALVKVYMVYLSIATISTFLDSVNIIYQKYPFAASRPIKGYIQVVKIILYIFGGIIIVAIIIGRDPSSLILGLGASTAILMLVFKDAINGLVASIQLSANKMLKIGDWIEMPNRNLDGNVIDISLTTVKVQNWDKTITTVPPYALVNESFKNWRGMEESEGRRVVKSLIIDSKTIKFCNRELLERLSKINLIKDIVADVNMENIDDQDPIALINANAQTNLNLFRRYVYEYLYHHSQVNRNLTLIVRLKQPTEFGIPFEIYFFLKEKRWVQYEVIQSKIIDHIFAALPVFDLKVYQRMTSDDIRALVNKMS